MSRATDALLWAVGTLVFVGSVGACGSNNPERIGDTIFGAGGYHQVEDVMQAAGEAAANLAAKCLENSYGEIAVVNNQRGAVGLK